MPKANHTNLTLCYLDLCKRRETLRRSLSTDTIQRDCNTLASLHAQSIKLERSVGTATLRAATSEALLESAADYLNLYGEVTDFSKRLRADLKDNAMHFDAALLALFNVRKATAEARDSAKGAWHLHDVLTKLVKLADRGELPPGITHKILSQVVNDFNLELTNRDGCFHGAKASFYGFWDTSSLSVVAKPTSVEMRAVSSKKG